jgi:hypothetical protein
VVDEEDDEDPEHPASARASGSANHPSPEARPTCPQELLARLIIFQFFCCAGSVGPKAGRHSHHRRLRDQTSIAALH